MPDETSYEAILNSVQMFTSFGFLLTGKVGTVLVAQRHNRLGYFIHPHSESFRTTYYLPQLVQRNKMIAANMEWNLLSPEIKQSLSYPLFMKDRLSSF